MTKKYSMILIPLYLLLWAGNAFSSNRLESIEKAITVAHDVAFVKVLEKHSELLGQDSIYTFITLQVLECFKGDSAKKQLTLMLPGGYVGGEFYLDNGGLLEGFEIDGELLVHTWVWENNRLGLLMPPLKVVGGEISGYHMNLAQFKKLADRILKKQQKNKQQFF